MVDQQFSIKVEAGEAHVFVLETSRFGEVLHLSYDFEIGVDSAILEFLVGCLDT
jgi:hypothetical protein